MIKFIGAANCELAEGPLWNPADGQLYFTDIAASRLWRLDPLSGQSEPFLQGAGRIGGFAFAHDGSLILCAENKILKRRSDGEVETLFVMDFPSGERFNDVTTDPRGRLYAGTMASGLFRFEKDRTPRKLLETVNCSNGMTFSLDERIFYHTATKDYVINSYDYDKSSGEISGRRDFFNCESTREWPDGLTIDDEGCLWSAFWTGGVKRLAPDGIILQEYDVPAQHPTSVIFGGENMNELFITTATEGIFRVKTPRGGRREWPAKL